jgi:endoglucanase
LSRAVQDTVVLALALGGIALSFTGCGSTSSSGTGPSSSGSSSSGTSSSGTTSIQAPVVTPQDRAVAAARHFLDRYVAPDGRVIRIDQGGDTVGEGQAYGMLMAAAIGDSRRFDAIWSWTEHNLRRSDGLISFLWKNGHIIDPQAATDADLDASRALLVASCRFHRPAYRQQAIALGHAILSVETAYLGFHGLPVATAGPWAITPKLIIDPSYFSPATFLALRAATGDKRWGSLAASSRAIAVDMLKPPARLLPDWAWIVNSRPIGIGSPSNVHTRPMFGFDAVRTLVRFAEDPDPAGRQIAAAAWPVFAGADPNNMPVVRDLSGRPIGDVLHPVVLVAAAGAASAAGQLAARDGLLDAAEALDQRSPTYYGAAWVALGRLMLTTNLLNPC